MATLLASRSLQRLLKQTFGRLFISSTECTKFSTSSKQQANEFKKTPLYDFHVKHGGKMVDFAGWALPVQYKTGIIASHLHTREKASIFDVSHMLQFKVHGKDRVNFMERLVVADIEGMDVNTGGLSLFTTPSGGIYDDCIINCCHDHLYVVSNAGCADKIKGVLQDHVKSHEHMDAAIEFLENRALLALQGPLAVAALQKGTSRDLSTLKFMNGDDIEVFGIPGCRVTRCGYTGEDGFEISVPADRIEHLAECLLATDNGVVQLAGLGPRDSLRLEAGLCLYGNDIDENTTPAEATLVWTIGKRRRKTADFPGADIILKQIKEKPRHKRVGIRSTGAPPRGGAKIHDADGNEIGHVTSGCPSPSLKQNVAMAYVPLALSKIGTNLKIKVHKREIEGEVVKMPFVPTKYFT